MTRRDELGETSSAAVFYAEDHCALRWPLLAAGLAPLLAIALCVLSFASHTSAVSWAGIAVLSVSIVFWGARGQLLPYVRPTGILDRLDSRGVRIGGMRWVERNPGRTRKATVPWQYAQVFACPWEGVHRIGVTTNRKAIRVMIRGSCHGLRPTPLGNLAAPFMQAALVIWVERDHAELPEIKPARGPLSANWSSPGFHQPIWIAPTRHRQRLEAALAALPLPAGTVSDPYEYANVDQQMSEWSAS